MSYHHYTNLLINIGVRHSMILMDMDTVKLSKQFQRMANFEVRNFFVLAR